MEGPCPILLWIRPMSFVREGLGTRESANSN